MLISFCKKKFTGAETKRIKKIKSFEIAIPTLLMLYGQSSVTMLFHVPMRKWGVFPKLCLIDQLSSFFVEEC